MTEQKLAFSVLILLSQEYLAAYPGTVLVVSHNRAFLNSVVTDIIHFHHKALHYYPGDFDAFQKTRRDHLQRMATEQKNLGTHLFIWM